MAYKISIPPSRRSIFLILSMFKVIKVFSSDLELFRIKIAAYNPHKDILAAFTFYIEQNKMGIIKSTYNICIINFLQTVYSIKNFKFEVNVITQIGFIVVMFFYIFFNIYDIIHEIIKLKLNYFFKI